MARGPAGERPQLKKRKTPRKQRSAESVISVQADAALERFPLTGMKLHDAVRHFTTDELQLAADANAAAQPDVQLRHDIYGSTFQINRPQLARSLTLFMPVLKYFRSGILKVFANEKGNDKQRWIDPAEWRRDSWVIIGDYYYLMGSRPSIWFENINVYKLDHDEEIEEVKPDRRRPGPKPSKDWAVLNFEFLKRAARKWPSDLKEAIEWYSEAIRDRNIHEYDEPAIKANIRRTFGQDFLDTLK